MNLYPLIPRIKNNTPPSKIYFTWTFWLCILSTLACSNANNTIVVSEKHNFSIDTLDHTLESPWGLAWLPDGRMLITEKKGEILIFNQEKTTGRTVQGLPKTYNNGQAGLLDIQIHPNYSENGWIYAIYTKAEDDKASTALIRFKLNKDHVQDLQELYVTQAIKAENDIHFGSRIVFDHAGHVYFSTGDRGNRALAQELNNDMGKVHRLLDNGQIPADNPFINHSSAKKSIWSYGHLNIQGMSYDAVNDILYATEHGPRGGDELNRIEKGKNYGWPRITYGIDYNGDIISEHIQMNGMEQPIHYWTPSIAPCGLMFYTGDRFPNWKNQLFSGSLAQAHVSRIELKNGRYYHEEKLLENTGRIRHISQGPKGWIYVLTESPGMLLKLAPTQ